ncbi:hypothetical protein [Gluconobacter kondonii]|uniref:hypothetical protein n=1 Tax=Gluconobacter kondonii TaxID=941463 RepID=UPI0011AF172E|nr:hypothetical protein [Gluconobacter kondonii]MBS1052314.1 hypothetical protein [Gluconobacter kondonii]MBS1055568.1 hypothetical protein [Gluconobacter kondonii]MBS1076315.1 hypothetical protein [Gluconobacter kondonii]MCP1236143.1 hypothetical protein [Gluconobacter kondonii]
MLNLEMPKTRNARSFQNRKDPHTVPSGFSRLLEIGPGPRRVNGEAAENLEEMSALSSQCHIKPVEHTHPTAS